MTKHHYQLLALALHRTKTTHEQSRTQWLRDVREIALALQADNPCFSYQKFCTMCVKGVES